MTFIGRRTHVDAINAHGLLLGYASSSRGTCRAKAATDASRPRLTRPGAVLRQIGRYRRSRPVFGRTPAARKHRFSVFKTVSTIPSVSAESPDTQSFPRWSMSAAKWPGPATSSITEAEHLAIGASPESQTLAETLKAADIQTTIADDIETITVEQAGHRTAPLTRFLPWRASPTDRCWRSKARRMSWRARCRKP